MSSHHGGYQTLHTDLLIGRNLYFDFKKQQGKLFAHQFADPTPINPTQLELKRQNTDSGIPLPESYAWMNIVKNTIENPVPKVRFDNQDRLVSRPRISAVNAPSLPRTPLNRRRSSNMSIQLPSPIASTVQLPSPMELVMTPTPMVQSPISGDATPMVQSPILSDVAQKKKRAREEQLADARDIQHYSKNYKKTTIFGKLKPKIKPKFQDRVEPRLMIEEPVVHGQAPMSPVPHLTAQKRKGSLIRNPKWNKRFQLPKQVPQIEAPAPTTRPIPNTTFTSIPTTQQHQKNITRLHNQGRAHFGFDRALVPAGRQTGIRVEELSHQTGFVRPTQQDLVVRRRSVGADGSLAPIRRTRRNSRTEIIAQSQSEQPPSPSARSLRRLRRNTRR
jgi:hypothetical protein